MRVYVAGPLYSSGNSAVNVRRAVECADALMDAGHHPYVPHLSHLADMICSRREEDWLELDREWLLQCGAVVRLPGESRGADLEEHWATLADIPVFLTVDDFLDWCREHKP